MNRDAKLRADAVANAKVKKDHQKGRKRHHSRGKNGFHRQALVLSDRGRQQGRGLDARLRRHDEAEDFAPTPSDTAEESAAVGEETADSTETSANQEVIATAKTNRAANLRQTMGGKGACAAQKGHKGQHLRADDGQKGNVWYKAQAQNGEKVGYLRDYVVTLDKGASTTGSSLDGRRAEDLPRIAEVIGKATTNRAANVREEPLANATVVRQLGNGMELQILAKYAGVKEETWYEVVTASGKTYGFVRDYVVYVTKLDKNAPTLTYEK